MSWKKLVANKNVVGEPPSKAELDNLRSIVARRMKDEPPSTCQAEGAARTQQALAQSPAVVGRGIDEIHARLKRHMHRADRLLEINGAELLTQRRGAVAKRRNSHARPAKGSKLHP